MSDNNQRTDIETPAISILAASSKTPFRTAFMVTVGIGLGRLSLFTGFLIAALLLYKLI